MQRSGNTTTMAPQVILLLFLGSCVCVWTRQLTDNYEKMRMFYNYPSGFKRLPSYDFGLGKRSVEESSYEEQLSPMDAFLEREQALLQQQQSGSGQGSGGVGPNGLLIYPNSLGKRTRAYGFGLGKRLTTENDWKLGGSSSFTPTYRQERRSKIYSFGLGKRQSHDPMEDYEGGNISPPTAERRANAHRQFAFGLGKRDLNAKE